MSKNPVLDAFFKKLWLADGLAYKDIANELNKTSLRLQSGNEWSYNSVCYFAFKVLGLKGGKKLARLNKGKLNELQ